MGSRKSSAVRKSLAQSQLFDSLPDGMEQSEDGREIAAGVMFVDPSADVLLLRRSSTEENFAGHWAFPGGKGDRGETAEQAASRECLEEIGYEPEELILIDEKVTPKGMVFLTYASPSKRFVPVLNKEHSGYAWFPLRELPTPMHPAVAALLSVIQQADKFTYREGDLEEVEDDEVDDIEDPSVVAHVDEDDFAEDEAFQESKHPRGQPGNAGQFTSGSGGGSKKTGSTPVARVLRVTLKAAGFKKTNSKTETSYVHPSGAKVIVHPSAAKKSAEFTIHKPGVDPKSGKGTALQKLLNDVVKQAESKQPTPTEVKKPESTVSTVDETLKNTGFKFQKGGMGNQLWKNPDSSEYFIFDTQDGEWEFSDNSGKKVQGNGTDSLLKALVGAPVTPPSTPKPGPITGFLKDSGYSGGGSNRHVGGYVRSLQQTERREGSSQR